MRVDFLPSAILAYMNKLKHQPDPLSVVKLYIEHQLSIPQTLRALRNSEERWIIALEKRRQRLAEMEQPKTEQRSTLKRNNGAAALPPALLAKVKKDILA